MRHVAHNNLLSQCRRQYWLWLVVGGLGTEMATWESCWKLILLLIFLLLRWTTCSLLKRSLKLSFIVHLVAVFLSWGRIFQLQTLLQLFKPEWLWLTFKWHWCGTPSRDSNEIQSSKAVLLIKIKWNSFRFEWWINSINVCCLRRSLQSSNGVALIRIVFLWVLWWLHLKLMPSASLRNHFPRLYIQNIPPLLWINPLDQSILEKQIWNLLLQMEEFQAFPTSISFIWR